MTSCTCTTSASRISLPNLHKAPGPKTGKGTPHRASNPFQARRRTTRYPSPCSCTPTELPDHAGEDRHVASELCETLRLLLTMTSTPPMWGSATQRRSVPSWSKPPGAEDGDSDRVDVRSRWGAQRPIAVRVPALASTTFSNRWVSNRSKRLPLLPSASVRLGVRKSIHLTRSSRTNTRQAEQLGQKTLPPSGQKHPDSPKARCFGPKDPNSIGQKPLVHLSLMF